MPLSLRGARGYCGTFASLALSPRGRGDLADSLDPEGICLEIRKSVKSDGDPQANGCAEDDLC
jgi:hypothetical protein